LDAGIIEAAPADFPLQAVFDRLASNFIEPAETKGLELVIRHTSLWVHSDRILLERVLGNLISNAIKFTPKGGSILVSAFVVHGGLLPALSIDFDKYKVFPAINDLKTKKDSICIAVSDTGIGIPESDLNRLFQTYKQAKISPVAKDEKGTGLGLVIAKGIAEAHDGTVGVVSKEGMGSTFFFTLPL
jgi:signal transduction histidine kinase